jgi:hypothetical protein
MDHDVKGEIPLGPKVQEPEDEVCDYRDPHLRPPPPNVPEPEGHCENNDGQQPPSTGKTGKLIQEEATGDELIRGDETAASRSPIGSGSCARAAATAGSGGAAPAQARWSTPIAAPAARRVHG